MKLLLTTVAAIAMATTSFAADIDASIEVEIAENQTTDKFEATTTLNVDVATDNDEAFGAISLNSVDNTSVGVDEWHLGTTVSGVRLSFGDHGGILPEANAATGFDTLADTNAAMTESLQVSTRGLGLALGLSDITTDVSEVANIQASYTTDLLSFGEVTAAVDYNRTSEEYTYAVAGSTDITGIAVGGIATYALDTWAFEAEATVAGLTGYLNGDENDSLQHIGVSASRDFNGITFASTVDYDTDEAQVTPSVTATFAF
jgi:hypothetical protein